MSKNRKKKDYRKEENTKKEEENNKIENEKEENNEEESEEDKDEEILSFKWNRLLIDSLEIQTEKQIKLINIRSGQALRILDNKRNSNSRFIHKTAK